METKTMTAPLTVVKRNGKTIALISSMRISETIQRGSVQGLGNLKRIEVPATSISCTASFDLYNVTFRDGGMDGAISRATSSEKAFMDNILFQDGIQFDIYKKVEDFIDENGLKVAKEEPHATITDAFIDSDSISVSEGQVSTRSQNFQYLTPIIFKL